MVTLSALKRTAILMVLGLSWGSFAADFFQLPDLSKGEIRDRAERRLLYNYERSVTKTADGSVVRRQFKSVEGQVVATETCYYRGSTMYKMEIEQNQIGGKGFFEVSGKEVRFQWEQDGKKKSDSESLADNMISGDQAVPFLQKNWDSLMKGDTLPIRFPVIDRAETVGFKFFKSSETADTVTIKMKPSSFVIASLVDPLLFKFQKSGDRKLLEVNGRVTPKIKQGDKWKDLDALFVLIY